MIPDDTGTSKAPAPVATTAQQHQVSGGLRYPAAGETQANSIRVPPGSRTIK